MATKIMPAEFKPSSPSNARKDKSLPSVVAASKALVESMDAGLGALCPITGLFIKCDLPPLPGLVMDAHHPLAYNALALLSHVGYCAALPPMEKSALILAALAAMGKLELKAPAFTINLALCERLDNRQRDQFLEFIVERMLTTKRCYPPLALAPNLSENTLLSYISNCYDVENTLANGLASANALAVPAFLSSSTQGKALNNLCYEAWLELAPHLPASTKEKAKPYIKQLATYLDGNLTAKLISACATYLMEDDLEGTGFEGELALSEFRHAVEESRRKAAALGLHRSILDLDDEPLFSTPAATPAPAPTIIALTSAALTAPAPVEVEGSKKGSFAARLAAVRAAAKGL